MSNEIPLDVAKAIARLRSEAREKMRIADDLERNYTGEDPKQRNLLANDSSLGPRRDIPSVVTVDTLIDYLKGKGGRPFELAKHFDVSEERIRDIIASSGGKLTIPDWRGWVKLGKHK
jgi:hypothetical protein